MTASEKTIQCELITGKRREIPAEKLIFRPAVYALVYNAPKLLLVNTKSTGKWFFPGGVIEKGEKTEEALCREVQEETGIILNELSFFTFKESFFYYEPHDQGYHSLNLFYLATPKYGEFQPIENDPTDEADRYEWVDVNSLQSSDMQSFAGEILKKFLQNIDQ
jgi:8-oxo-dGTP pyrophosphatase MutT (NUDIX family)